MRCVQCGVPVTAVVSATTRAHIQGAAGIRPAPMSRMGKETTMMTLITRLREAASKRARYLQTRDEIARMPQDVARDLNIYPGDASRIAREAVYGRA